MRAVGEEGGQLPIVSSPGPWDPKLFGGPTYGPINAASWTPHQLDVSAPARRSPEACRSLQAGGEAHDG